MTQEQNDEINQRIVDCVFNHIDRMNDICEHDTADRILEDFVPKMNVLLEEYLELKFPSEHRMRQQWLEFRSPEELAQIEKEREFRRRPRPGFEHWGAFEKEVKNGL